MNANELRIGNLVNVTREDQCPFRIDAFEFLSKTFIKVAMIHPEYGEKFHPLTWYGDDLKPIPLTEEWLLKFGFSVINESSAGKRYGYVINGIFSSDLTFTFWKTTKEAGKFFRGDLELKHVHQLQNLYFALTNKEL